VREASQGGSGTGTNEHARRVSIRVNPGNLLLIGDVMRFRESALKAGRGRVYDDFDLASRIYG
jgi:hypothetical protein